MQTKRYQKEAIDEIAEALKNKKIIAFPTDTVFGLGCIYDEEKAIRKVMEAKNRPYDKPLPMMCADSQMIKDVAFTDEKSQRLMQAFMPGAITIVFPKKEVVPSFVTLGLPSIGIRIPDDPWIIELIHKVGKPLLVTSANLSSQGSLLHYQDVEAELDGRIDGIVEEDARGDKASTIVSVLEGELKELREGPIAFEDIKKEYEG